MWGIKPPIHITPHKISLLILSEHYFKSDLDCLAKQHLGLFLLSELTVQASFFSQQAHFSQVIKDLTEKDREELFWALEGLPHGGHDAVSHLSNKVRQFIFSFIFMISFLFFDFSSFKNFSRRNQEIMDQKVSTSL